MSVVCLFLLLLWHLCLCLWRMCCQLLDILLWSLSDALIIIIFFFKHLLRNEGWSFLLHVCTFLCLHASSLISNRVHSSPIRLLSGVGSQVQQDIQGLPLTSERCRIYDPPSDSWSSVTWQSGNCESLFQSFDGNCNAVRIHDGQWMHLHKKR